MSEKRLKEVIRYFNYKGKITIITKDEVIDLSTEDIENEMLQKKVRSSQLNCGHLTIWMEI